MTGTSPEQGEMRSGGQISMGIGSKRSVGGGQPVLLTLRGQRTTARAGDGGASSSRFTINGRLL
jgi:hypothetical protein